MPLTYALYQLVAHPNAQASIGNRALKTLLDLLSLDRGPEGNDTDIELCTIAESLFKMGAKRAIIPQDLQEASDLELLHSAASPDKTSFTAAGRVAATRRLLEVIQVLVRTK